VTDADMKLISQPLDFIGYNSYSGRIVRAKLDGGYEMLPLVPGAPVTTMDDFHVVPDCLYWAARLQTERYPGLPFVITENGFAGTDWVADDGGVHDPARIDATGKYLRGLMRAARESVPVGGYFYWSLMDNFEWAKGYRPRFGLIHVDYETQKRTLKDSARWYRRIIESKGGALGVETADRAGKAG
jgi:beta-glucosidase